MTTDCISTDQTLTADLLYEGETGADYFVEVGVQSPITITFAPPRNGSISSVVVTPSIATLPTVTPSGFTITFTTNEQLSAASNEYYLVDVTYTLPTGGSEATEIVIDDIPVKKPKFKPVGSCP